MYSSRGQYTSAPLYNMKNRRPVPPSDSPQEPKGGKPQGNRRNAFLSIMLSVGLPILFLLALFIPSFWLRVAFLGLTLLCAAMMWGLRTFSPSARNTLSIVYAALFAVIALALLMSLPSPENQRTAQVMADPQEVFSADTSPNALSSLMQSTPTESPEPDVQTTSIAQQRLEEFLQYWAKDNYPGMLSICTPSWVAQQQSPEQELWNMILNRRPVQYVIENAQGSDLDSTRTITIKVAFVKDGSNEPTLNRIQVLMFRTNDQWYIDPQSLSGTVVDEAAELKKQQQMQQQNSIIGSTIAPTSTPVPEGSKDALLLYYNSDGGKYYHSKPNCSAVNQEYWPLTKFYYSELNTTKFKNLTRCPKCDPPARP